VEKWGQDKDHGDGGRHTARSSHATWTGAMILAHELTLPPNEHGYTRSVAGYGLFIASILAWRAAALSREGWNLLGRRAVTGGDSGGRPILSTPPFLCRHA
jgi:hypothetical protein